MGSAVGEWPRSATGGGCDVVRNTRGDVSESTCGAAHARDVSSASGSFSLCASETEQDCQHHVQ